MTALRFSVKARDVAFKFFYGRPYEEGDDDEQLAAALNAALAHDAERLAREIIEQRMAAISDEILQRIWEEAGSLPDYDYDWLYAGPAIMRAALLRALMDQPGS